LYVVRPTGSRIAAHRNVRAKPQSRLRTDHTRRRRRTKWRRAGLDERSRRALRPLDNTATMLFRETGGRRAVQLKTCLFIGDIVLSSQ